MIKLRGHHLTLLYGYLHSMKFGNIEMKKKSIVDTAIHDGKSKRHGEKIISVLEKIVRGKDKIKLTDEIDEICVGCRKMRKSCRNFIPYGISAASGDRGTIHYYGLVKREYTFEFLEKRLFEIEKGKIH